MFAQIRRVEEMLARVGAAFDGVFLILAVHDFAHARPNRRLVLLQQRIPIAAPDHFDDVPTGAAEDAFEFLNDLAVAAHRPVQSLQVAVDDPGQIVQFFARRERNRAQRFRFVGFAVAEKGPNARFARVFQAAMLQIAIKTRLINRAESGPGPSKPWEIARNPASATDADKKIDRRPAAIPGES